MAKLLWPERWLGPQSMKVTTEDSDLPDLFGTIKDTLPDFAGLPDLDVSPMRVPKGTPVNLLTNLDPYDIKTVLQSYVDEVLQGAPKEKFAELQPKNNAVALAANDGQAARSEHVPGLHRRPRAHLWA